jgi:hypothetical protein
LGDFVRRVSAETPDSLFAITADHWGRNFPGPRPTAFEKAIVPMVFYGPDVLPKDIDGSKLSGSHYDLGSTLIEFVADAGFEYRAIGRNMLKPKPDHVAMSRLWLLGEDFITAPSQESTVETLDGVVLANKPESFQSALRHYNLTHGITWWRLRQGNNLPEK